jgi:uncharacterized protein YndB with AHSA1/START domain
MKQIIHAVQIHAAPATVYRALTTAKGLGGWWSKTVEAEERQGGIIRFTFAGDFHPQMQQRRLDRDRRVEWVCIAGHDNWRDNGFTFALEDRKGETLLTFSQDYARELSDEVYGIYNFNWGLLLEQPQAAVRNGERRTLHPSRGEVGVRHGVTDYRPYSSCRRTQTSSLDTTA